jgi:hypothetical protein
MASSARAPLRAAPRVVTKSIPVHSKHSFASHKKIQSVGRGRQSVRQGRQKNQKKSKESKDIQKINQKIQKINASRVYDHYNGHNSEIFDQEKG